MRRYLEAMALDERLIIINKGNDSHTLVTFSICNDSEPYIEKGVWEYISHNPKGTICYIEKVITDGWSRELRKQLEIEIKEKYPQIQWAEWHRPRKSEDTKVKRRLHEASL